MQSQAPPVVFQMIHTYLLITDIYYWASVPRQTDSSARKLHLGPKTTGFFLLCVFGLTPKLLQKLYFSHKLKVLRDMTCDEAF